MNSWLRSEASRATVKSWAQSFSLGYYPLILQQAGKGFTYNPPINFTRQMHLDRSWSFGNKLSNSLLISRSLASIKHFFFGFPRANFSLSACLLFSFSSISIIVDNKYQIGQQISSDNHRLILYHKISFIQWQATEINQWVILDVILSVCYCVYSLAKFTFKWIVTFSLLMQRDCLLSNW